MEGFFDSSTQLPGVDDVSRDYGAAHWIVYGYRCPRGSWYKL